ncbi:type IV secretory system conjugative DNA transfer family protein [Kaistella palustris]|uniref:type IV secretory system conjugative DNA transfer family protein n=1 Tax=Kaistella palustris TaxID=493376 RepID=UPI0003F6508E|nr:type IV secretory system conjugative DNA transfer family protein [Kaistella palustris]
MKILDLTLRNWFILLAAVSILTFLLTIIFKARSKVLKFVFLTVIGFLTLIGAQMLNYKIIGLYLLLPSIICSSLIYLWIYEKSADPVWDVEFKTSQGKRIIRGIQRGVAVFGAAGSGKTISVLYNILQHFGKAGFAGIIYDFKDGELTELATAIFEDRLKVVAIHNPNISYRVNPIAPEYITGEKDVNQLVKVLMDNLIKSGAGKGDDFFKDSASSLLSGVILKFWFDHRDICTLPHVTAFILGVDFSLQNDSNLENNAQEEFAKLKHFLNANERVAIQASTFILGLASARQTASVISTLANGLRKMAFPEAFYVLSGNDLDFNVNAAEINSVVSVLNEPKSAEFLSPANAAIIHSITKQMMVRNRKPSFIMLDEAPTLQLLNMAQIPATMRSFGVAVVYCAQDFVQGVVQYGRDGFREIVANLSTQFFGKSNDSETSKFYESYFELVNIKTKSISRKGSEGNLLSWGESSTTTGEREVHKHRASEFNRLSVGQFAFLSDGKNEIVNINHPQIISRKIENQRVITTKMLDNHFKKIMVEARSLL